MTDIFLSYSHSDSLLANILKREFERVGLTVWIDRLDLEVGTRSWQAAIKSAIDTAKCVVILQSPEAKASEWVNWEISYALDLERVLNRPPKQVFPVIIRGDAASSTLLDLKNYQHKDLTTDTETGTRTLIAAIATYVGKRSIVNSLNRYKWQILLAVLIFSIGILGGYLLTDQTVYPTASLVSARYMAANYDPHLIDFRTAAKDGVPFGVGQSLRLTDVWVWGSLTNADYQVQVQLYVNDEMMGETQPQPLQAGIYQLGDIIPKRDFFEDTTDAWFIQTSWEVLDLRLVLLQGEKVIHEEHFPIKHNANGLSRMLDMPLANIVSVLYSLNGGPIQVLDISAVVRTGGLELHIGDQLRLYEIWYNTDTTNGSTSFDASAYLTQGGYNERTDRRSESVVFDQGLHFIETSKQFNWVVDENYKLLVISLERADEALIDRLIIPLASGG